MKGGAYVRVEEGVGSSKDVKSKELGEREKETGYEELIKNCYAIASECWVTP